jgi:hypothetical protein
MNIFASLESRIVGFKEEGKAPRPWYGMSHFDLARGQYVLYPIPLNLISAACRLLYILIVTGCFFFRSQYQRELRKAWIAGRQAAYDEMEKANKPKTQL